MGFCKPRFKIVSVDLHFDRIKNYKHQTINIQTKTTICNINTKQCALNLNNSLIHITSKERLFHPKYSDHIHSIKISGTISRLNNGPKNANWYHKMQYNNRLHFLHLIEYLHNTQIAGFKVKPPSTRQMLFWCVFFCCKYKIRTHHTDKRILASFFSSSLKAFKSSSSPFLNRHHQPHYHNAINHHHRSMRKGVRKERRGETSSHDNRSIPTEPNSNMFILYIRWEFMDKIFSMFYFI